jgi:cytochrome c-type biogenesis protein CcmE
MGQMLPDGTFQAQEVLAKHDQYYRPPGIGPKLDTRQGAPRDAALQQAPATASAGPSQAAAEHP